MQTFSRLALTRVHHALVFRSAGPSEGFELNYRLSKFHSHMTSLP